MPDDTITIDEGISAVLRERIVVAPARGRYVPLDDATAPAPGEWVEAGDVVGEIASERGPVPVRSPFSGWLMGVLALRGQPVAVGDALMWIDAA
ncbi:MAG TPA: biotin/lipoyl-containing protein [Actinomycetota bacterium]|nr:biotin/lipoyl-containing protein [Actinomycetota bacterium]